MKIVGCKEAKEISLTRAGANQHAHVLIRKNMAFAQPLETADMDIVKALKAMTPEARDHVLALEGEAQKSFFELDAAGQAAEVEKAKKKTPPPAATGEAEPDADDMKKSVAELTKSNAAQAEQITELLKRDAERTQTIELEKRARTEFAAFPGGETKVVPLLKSFATLPEADRLAAEGVLKSQCEFASRAGSHLAVVSDEDFAKSNPASTEIEKKAQEIAKAKGVSLEIARGEVLADPVNSSLFDQAFAEENRARAG